LSLLARSVYLPDFIFCDINMPVMGGVECLTEIIKSQRTKHIPVVILSSDTGQIELIRELGAIAFIAKPDDSLLLKKQIEVVINLDFRADIKIAAATFQNAVSFF
jgi:CheY-like chemotaxis protein